MMLPKVTGPFTSKPKETRTHITTSVTRLGDLLDFGQLLKPLATINLPKSSTFLDNFCEGVIIYHFSNEITLRHILQTFGDFFCHTESNQNISSNETIFSTNGSGSDSVA